MEHIQLGSMKTPRTASACGGLFSRPSRKAVGLLIAGFLAVGFYLHLHLSQIRLSWDVQPLSNLHGDQPHFDPDACEQHQQTTSVDIWNAAQEKYKDLKDDKFTIAIQTYRRPDELNNTLHLLLDTNIPSLHEIVIVWNDIETKPPDNFVSAYSVPVRYRVSQRNNLNEKLRPDPDYRTKAILLSDDDVHYNPSDLEFVFQTWRKHGQDRLTGAFARCVGLTKKGEWAYNFCRNRDSYSMILTGLAFTHISFLDYFYSDDPLMTKLRGYTEEQFNCEDIAMNFMVSMLTCRGPLQVSGAEKPINEEPARGISKKKGHLKARNKCVRDFVELFGYLPLQNTTEYIGPGVM